MNHLVALKDLKEQEIIDLIELADKFVDHNGKILKDSIFPDKKIVNIFCEPSTRTKTSFELAAKNLGCEVINFNYNFSSIIKGESLLDTIVSFEEMGIDLCVLRHKDSVIHSLIENTKNMIFISGGEGAISHPTQGLLDLMTIKSKKGLENNNILVVGHLDHSRVFKSFLEGIVHFKNNITVCGHKDLCKEYVNSSLVTFEPDLEKAIRDKDVIMGLRIQKERINEDININIDEYSKNFQITNDLLSLANPGCILMHPGPVNKGIELSQNAYSSKNSVINEQVKNGVAIRMAILTKYFST
tara:strand:- start:479 stop:1378 length:900 start_codon:yes stop_codon:yes gene_type:complete